MPHGKLKGGGKDCPLKDNLANRSHMFPFVFLLPFSVLNFITLGHLHQTESFSLLRN